VTDGERTLDGVFATLARLGVRDAAVSTAFMRPHIDRALKREVRDKAMANALLSHYASGPTLTMTGAGTCVRMPPAATRRAIYRRALRIAERHGVGVRICACKNGDLAGGSCGIAGRWDGQRRPQAQGELFPGGTAHEASDQPAAALEQI